MRSEPTVPGLYFTASLPPVGPSPLRSDVAGFIGRTKRGPEGEPPRAVRVGGWRGYQREFGGLASDAVMTYAIRGYFENEGEVAHVIRLCHASATAASAQWNIGELNKKGEWGDSAPVGFEYQSYRIEASSRGAWANNSRVAISYRRRGASGNPELDITVAVPDEPVQYFTGLTLGSSAPADTENPAKTFEEFVATGSRFIRLIPLGPKIHDARAPGAGPHAKEWDRELTLSGGQDSANGETPGKLDYLNAITSLGDISEVALVAVPGLFEDIHDEPDALDQQNEVLVALVKQAEELRDRVVLVDVKTDSELEQKQVAIKEVKEILTWIDALRIKTDDKAARAAAVYHPRLTIQDPLGGVRHPLRNIPPSGHVAGVISRLDRQRGAHHTPANAEILGAVDVTQRFDPLEQARLNTNGVNLLRCFPGKGLMVWGGRTLHLAPERRFLVYRRLIHRLVRAIRRVAEPLVFDNNGPELWLALARSITTVLLEAWRAGALKGERHEEAFRVQCDEKLNPPEERDLGRVHCEIDVAPATPMEFIQLRVSFSGDGRLEVFES